MRKSIGIVLSILLFLRVTAQQNTIDSLHQLLATAKEDTTRVNLLNQVSRSFFNSKPDSALIYADRAKEFSQKIGYVKGEVRSLTLIGGVMIMTANFPKALEIGLEALTKSEASGDERLIASSYRLLNGVYSEQGDLQQAMPYALKEKKINEKTNDERTLSSNLVNIGNTYRQLNQLDSARIYLNQALNIALRLGHTGVIAASYLNLGMIHTKMKQYDIAIGYLKLAIPNFKIDNNPLNLLITTYDVLAEVYDSTNQADSAFYYARLTYDRAKEMNYIGEVLSSSQKLASLFKTSKQLDSSILYYQIAMSAKDSLTSQEKQKQIQALTFNEELRQIKIAKQKSEEVAARKRNLELAGIAIFIPLFLFAVLLLGRRKVKSRTIEFLGILGLLFLFEFIVLFTHPYIGHWTHESPVWMLLILVVVAAILIPLHHRSEAWIKKKLASKAEMKLQAETL
jgi:tetratricopeptide (TPR) repeat protein